MVIQRTSIYKGRSLELGLEVMEQPDKAAHEVEIVRHPESAAVVAVNAVAEICLLRRYRLAVRNWVWEIPLTRIEPNEIPLLSAQRELEQIANLHGNVWTSLGAIFSTPGFCDEVIHLFLAHELSPCKPSDESEEQEQSEIHWVNFHEALTRAYMGKICDAKTLAGLFHAQAYVDHGH